ncbi:MAG: MATE family efflux transporter [Bulleidia sp.]
MMYDRNALRKLIVPLVIEQILVMVVGMADTMMVSQAGEAAVSGVGLVDMLNNLVITVLAAVAAGGAVIISQYIGNGDPEHADTASSQLMTITAVVSVVIMAVCLLFRQSILNLFFGSIEADVMNACMTYFLITALSFPFLGIYNSASALFRSIGKTDVTMKVSLLMNTINVVGNYIGVIVLKAAVVGVAIPTLISRIIAAGIMSVLSLDSRNTVHVSMQEAFSVHSDMIRRILRIAVPNGIENGLFTLGRVLVTGIVAMFGTSQIAANSVAGSIDQIAIVVVNAINLGIVTVVGQCVGAGDYEQASYYIRKLMKTAGLITAGIGGLVIAALPLLLNIYSLSEETRSYVFILVIMHNIMACLLHPTSFVLPNGLRAAGDVKYSMYVGIASMVVFRLGTAVLFGIFFHLGIIGVWIAMGADWFCRSVCFVYRFQKGTWKNRRVIA